MSGPDLQALQAGGILRRCPTHNRPRRRGRVPGCATQPPETVVGYGLIMTTLWNGTNWKRPLFKGWANLCRASGALGIRGDSHERDG